MGKLAQWYQLLTLHSCREVRVILAAQKPMGLLVCRKQKTEPVPNKVEGEDQYMRLSSYPTQALWQACALLHTHHMHAHTKNT